MPSWPSVVVGAIAVGALLGAAQKDAGDDTPDPPEAPVVADAPGEQPLEQPLPSPTSVQPPRWPQSVRVTLPPQGTARIALTFDDGPSSQWTPQVLDVLARNDVVATFCVVGDQVSGNEQVLRRIHAEGHVLCNHTMSHDYGLPTRQAERIRSEISATADLITAVVPDAELFAFRAPGGRFDPDVVQTAAALGLDSWAWSIDPQDWNTTDSDSIVTATLDRVAPDAVVLLHDGGGDRSATVAALEEIIPVLRSVGYEFVGLPDLT